MNIRNIYSNILEESNVFQEIRTRNIFFDNQNQNQNQLIKINNLIKIRKHNESIKKKKQKNQKNQKMNQKNQKNQNQPDQIKDPQNIKQEINLEPQNIKQESEYHVKRVYIISNIDSGGSIKYLDDIKKQYTNVKFVHIKNKESLLTIKNAKPYDVLFVQQLLWTNILPQDIINIKTTFSMQIVISIHDFCWFIEDDNINNPKYNVWEQGYLTDITKINPKIIDLFQNASIVIHPSEFTKTHYSRFFPTHNSILQEHNDIEIDYFMKRIPKIEKNVINIGNFQGLSEYKGKENVIILNEKYHNCNWWRRIYWQ